VVGVRGDVGIDEGPGRGAVADHLGPGQGPSFGERGGAHGHALAPAAGGEQRSTSSAIDRVVRKLSMRSSSLGIVMPNRFSMNITSSMANSELMKPSWKMSSDSEISASG